MKPRLKKHCVQYATSLVTFLLLPSTIAVSLAIDATRALVQPFPSRNRSVKQGTECQCKNAEACQWVKGRQGPEVLGFFWPPDQPYKDYRWDTVSTIAWGWGPGANNPDVVCVAHSHKTRVVINADDVSKALVDEQERALWVEAKVKLAREQYLDGINFDYEEPMKPRSPLAYNYTLLVAQTAKALRAENPHTQVSVDVPWTPYDADGRNFDWLGLADAADLLVVMAYDMQAQMYGRCVAAANSPLALVEKGLVQWLDLGIPPEKLLLAVPWYGYVYACQPDASGRPVPPDTDLCAFTPVGFRGAPCSDAGGSQRDYHNFMDLLRAGLNSTPVVIDPLSQCPTFNYVDTESGQVNQVWFELPQTLRLKYRLTKQYGLAGVAMWNLGCLDHTSRDPQVQRETHDMWSALAEELHAA